MAWHCAQCGEASGDKFDRCWRCGADREGVIDPDFEHADDYTPPLVPEVTAQFSLERLLQVVTLLCLALALLGSAAEAVPKLLRIVLGMGAVGIVFLHLVTWAMLRRVRQLQQLSRHHSRKSSDEP